MQPFEPTMQSWMETQKKMWDTFFETMQGFGKSQNAKAWEQTVSAGEEILKIFEDLWGQGHTLVIITHNPYIADCAQRVVKLRDGLVEEDSTRSS